jgi:hypothetical protein
MLRPPEAQPFRVGLPGVMVAATVMATAIMVQFTASAPRRVAVRATDPGPPRLADFGTDAGAEQLARMSDRLAEARERVGAAREGLESARRRFDWRLTRESPKLLSASPGLVPGPAPAPPRQVVGQDAFELPAAPSTRWPGRAQTIEDLARVNVLRPDAPRITGFSHARAAAGTRVAVDGRGFAGTSRVLFAAPAPTGRAWHDADFRVRDDGRLILTVPDLGPGQRPATVVVLTPRGAAVSVSSPSTLVSVHPALKAPAGDSGLYFIAAGATLTPARGAVVVVDRGATVQSAAGSLLVVRAGGAVERARADCLIIHETPRPEARDLAAVPVLDVPALNTCFIESSFQYAGQNSGR